MKQILSFILILQIIRQYVLNLIIHVQKIILILMIILMNVKILQLFQLFSLLYQQQYILQHQQLFILHYP